MTVIPDEAAARHWLVDYLVTKVGCSPDEIDCDAPLTDLGVGSRDAVTLSGEVSELLGRPVSPVEFWQYPTISALAKFMSGAAPESQAETTAGRAGAMLDEPIAVIGLGCRFPGDISGPESLWQFLCDGRSAVGKVPGDRWASFDDGSVQVAAVLSHTTRWGSFLSDVDLFDAEFFEILPREAAKMDPQQRLLLEVAWEALENAGTPPNSLRHSHTGVFVGACVSEYGFLASTDLPGVDAWNNTGGALSIIANRLSYFLDLRGPSFAVDTACSSSLVAVHLACQSLRSGDANLAIAAGVNLLLSPAVFHGFDQAGALSPTGRCHAFDAGADGFVRGEGCGVAILKRLKDAQRDGDRVLAVVRGSAVNQDGRSNGLMAPNPAAQMAVLRTAYANAGASPQEVDYVEAHGTGTLLGDPIEARALGTVLGPGRAEDSPLLIGSIKSNLGHLEAAAGIAGFIKAVMAVERGSIPPSLHFQTPNPHIPFGQLRLKVAAAQHQWPPTEHLRRAGVSSFGFGGTNAHVVLEQAPTTDSIAQNEISAVTTLLVSGKSQERIASLAGMLADWMTGQGVNVPLVDAAHTLNHHRTVHPRFATVSARDRAQAVAGLRALAEGRSVHGVTPAHDGPCGAGTVFVYSGQGAQWAGMGRRLLVDEPAFAEAIDQLEPVFVEQVGFSLQQVLTSGESVSGDARVQPVTMGLQLALTALWRSYGVQPDAVIGHSMGEVTAAVVAEALSVDEGLRMIAIRSRLMSRLAGQGAVALLKLDAATTAALLGDYPDVSVAGYASPRQTVIAGPPKQVDDAIAAVQRQNRFARRVNMEVASHTSLMDAVLPELRAALADLIPKAPVIQFFSTVADPARVPVLDVDYWVANVRRPVRFSDAVTAAAQHHTSFIEISAHPMLTQAITETLETVGHHHSIGTLWRDSDDTISFHTSLNAVHTTKPPVTPHPPEPHPVLPTTPWHHGHHWITRKRPLPPRESVGTGRDSVAPNVGVVPSEWYCELGWPIHPLPCAVRNGANDYWLVVAEDSLGAALGRILGDDSRLKLLTHSTLSGHADQAALLRDALAGVTHVLYAPESSSGGMDARLGYRLFNAARSVAAAIAGLALPPRLFLLTRNAQPMSPGDRANPAHAVLWGLGRTLALEHPELWGAVVDIDESVPAEPAARYLLAEALGGGGEDQVVYRAGLRHVPRLRSLSAPSTASGQLDGQRSHLVIGATGNIGPHLLRQLADMGAANIVAVSRNPGSRLEDLAAALSAQGTTLTTVAADASDEATMTALVDRFGTDFAPLGGIYVAAFGGGPVTLRDMTDEDVTAMFAPKLDVVSLLHRLSLNQPVTQFVLFSSISGLVGSRWLGHYAATTTFLDTFAFARRAAGLPATAINWGLWKSLASNQNDEQQRVSSESGLEPMPDEVAIQGLRLITGPHVPARCTIVAADWSRLATAYRTRAPLHIVDDLVPVEEGDQPAAAAPTTEFLEALRTCDPAQRRALLADHVTKLVAEVMGMDSPQSLDRSTGFFQFGMDSLMSLTLQRALGETIGVTVPTSVVFDYPTVEALTDYLAALLAEFAEFGGQHGAPNGELTEDELLQQLSERLSGAR
ncbi:polyketide synthase family protein [Mycobacterium sp. JS623]|uniref:SDR family NAD(P)-dependent oxidoreductase n=1 Tax=Mycobacterium sp. JS623 TaxID=212767 RepID=UPI0002A57F9A|nr:type I polyketide synthase [Mycobacterium sp. JS623]AGB26048.1 polyketide synthase family protein [Mycobacterium sp. JS623]